MSEIEVGNPAVAVCGRLTDRETNKTVLYQFCSKILDNIHAGALRG